MFSAQVRRWELTFLNGKLCLHGELWYAVRLSHHQQKAVSDFRSLSFGMESTRECMTAPSSLHTRRGSQPFRAEGKWDSRISYFPPGDMEDRMISSMASTTLLEV